MKVLIVGPSWVGDTVLAQPLFMRLHERHDNLQLDVLAPRWTLGLLARMPEVSSSLPSPFGHGALDIGGRRRLGHGLRARGYDRAVVLPNSFKSALAPWFARIPLRSGYVGEARGLLLNDARRLDADALPLMVERYAALAEPHGATLRRPLPRPRLITSSANLSAVLTRLGLDLDRPVICFCPGAEYGVSKRWPAEHYAQLGSALADAGFQVWLLGSSKDREVADAIALGSERRCRNLCGDTSLEEVVDLLSKASVVVSNDSGLMHVAAAVGRPLVALYGSSSPAFTPPLATTAEILKLDLPCSPCFKRECPLGHFDCMRKLEPAAVCDRVLQLVRQAGRSAPTPA